MVFFVRHRRPPLLLPAAGTVPTCPDTTSGMVDWQRLQQPMSLARTARALRQARTLTKVIQALRTGAAYAKRPLHSLPGPGRFAEVVSSWRMATGMTGTRDTNGKFNHVVWKASLLARLSFSTPDPAAGEPAFPIHTDKWPTTKKRCDKFVQETIRARKDKNTGTKFPFAIFGDALEFASQTSDSKMPDSAQKYQLPTTKYPVRHPVCPVFYDLASGAKTSFFATIYI